MRTGIQVTICRNMGSEDQTDEEFEEELQSLLRSIGRDWVVTDFEFIDENGWR